MTVGSVCRPNLEDHLKHKYLQVDLTLINLVVIPKKVVGVVVLVDLLKSFISPLLRDKNGNFSAENDKS